MAGKPRGLFRDQLRTLFDVGTAAGLTDGQLLERFATRRDEAAELAFAALVERHGPMVLRACRGILRDDHEALDAFQATFFVLARKGGSLWVRDSLGPWLHRVACHAAGRARRTMLRRRAIEAKAAEMAGPRTGGGDRDRDRDDLAAAVQEEVDRLPERYRAAIVLCDLEGRTFEEAARHLGCPVGTVGSRLSRGRERLRARLGRRGLACGPLTASWMGPHVPLPAGLVGSTALAAARFVSLQAVPPGAAVSLAQGVLRTMIVIRWWKVAIVLCAMGASTSGVLALAGRGGGVAEARAVDAAEATLAADDVKVAEVVPGKLRLVVEERGSLEAANDFEGLCKVEGLTTIMRILPDGEMVTKGDVVCELDSAALRDQLTNQEIATRGAQAAHEDARHVREDAELALTEYLEGIYPRDLQDAVGEVALARSAIAKAQERLKRTQAARQLLSDVIPRNDRVKTVADVVAALDVDERLDAIELDIERQQLALERSQTRRQLLQKYTRDRTVKQHRNAIEKAHTLELARQASWQLEQSKGAKLERQIASCRIVAPTDGVMVYANSTPGWQQIEEGATVRERQKIFTIPDVRGPMRTVAMIPEAIVDKLGPGMKAQVKVDAFSDLTLSGVVQAVAPRPARSGTNAKFYPTHILINERVPGLRPGMTAAVEILVAEVDNALSVPDDAVVWYDGKYHLAVRKPDGEIDWRAVTLGLSDGKRVEVKEGLERGDRVALEPRSLLSEEQKRKMSAPPARFPPQPRSRAVPALPPAIRARLLAMPAEDRVKLRDLGPDERHALLKKAGFTDQEIRRLDFTFLRPSSSR